MPDLSIEKFLKKRRAWRSQHRQPFRPATWQDGADAVIAVLKRGKIDVDGLLIADGSGLSRDNRLSARLLTEVLAVSFRSKHQKLLLDSLPVSGVDGSLARRMLAAKGQVYGKTGLISGSRTLAGYIRTKSGRWLAFAILFNGSFGMNTRPLSILQDQVCELLAAGDV